MAARIEYGQREIRVYLDGEIDHHSASLIRASIDDAIIQKRPELLVLDFSEVTFMDSSGIGLAMGRYKLMRSVSGKIRLENLSPTAYRVMKLSGMELLGEIKQKEAI